MTLTPVWFSLVSLRSVSSPFCIFSYLGMLQPVMKTTTKAKSAIVTTKTSACLKSIVNAIAIAPNTTKGDLKRSLIVMLTPCWTWFISLVILVIMADVPSLSISEYDNFWILSKRAFFAFLAKPAAAFAAKNCAVTALIQPTKHSNISKRHIFMT